MKIGPVRIGTGKSQIAQSRSKELLARVKAQSGFEQLRSAILAALIAHCDAMDPQGKHLDPQCSGCHGYLDALSGLAECVQALNRATEPVHQLQPSDGSPHDAVET